MSTTAELRQKIAAVSAELAAIRQQGDLSPAEQDADTDARMAVLALLSYANRLDHARQTATRDDLAASDVMRAFVGDLQR